MRFSGAELVRCVFIGTLCACALTAGPVASFPLAAAGPLPPSSEDPEEVLRQLARAYDGLEDAVIRFTRQVRFGAGRLEQTHKGVLWLKKGNMRRLETEERTIVTDGRTVWSYSPLTRQVMIDDFRPDAPFASPDRILGEAPGNYDGTVLGRERLGNTPVILIKLTPRDEAHGAFPMRLWVDPHRWMILKAEVREDTDRVVLYTADEIRTDTGLEDARFRYVPPDGAEIVDLRR
ncbi:MAG: outer membrane lipoprotein carrier protein LolA [Bacteroidota bacterium]